MAQINITKESPSFWRAALDNPPINLFGGQMIVEMRALLDAAENDPELTELLRAVIRRDASPEQVARAGEAVEAYVAAHPKAKDQLGQIAHRVVGSGKLETYGTPAAQKLITNWAERFGPKPAKTKEKGAEPK